MFTTEKQGCERRWWTLCGQNQSNSEGFVCQNLGCNKECWVNLEKNSKTEGWRTVAPDNGAVKRPNANLEDNVGIPSNPEPDSVWSEVFDLCTQGPTHGHFWHGS